MIDSIIKAVEELNEDKIMKLVKYYLSNGEKPSNIINSIQTGLVKVGDLFSKKQYYLADLIMGGIIFKEVLALKEMRAFFNSVEKSQNAKPLIVIGTIKGDLHDIGKQIFSGIAIASGYKVIDLGVDVPPEEFLNSYYKYKPKIIGISGVLTDSIRYMKDLVDLFKKTGERKNVKIIIGGNAIKEENFKYIGADAYAKDVKQGIQICDQWIRIKRD